MKLANTVYFGIDPTSGNKDFSYAVLDGGLNLLTLADADKDELLSFLDKYESVFVAVNAPARVNHGLVKARVEKETNKPGRTLRGVDIRLAEYELRGRGISITGTPSREEFCPTWIQVGFGLYRELSALGFQPYGVDDAPRQYLETHPYACFCALLEGIPFSKPTLEGRLQRQLLLNDKRLRITDAMSFFEEITRFKLMRGILPEDIVYSPEQLDVLVAAYTAWQAAEGAETVTRVGDPDEGQLILPVEKLLDMYE